MPRRVLVAVFNAKKRTEYKKKKMKKKRKKKRKKGEDTLTFYRIRRSCLQVRSDVLEQDEASLSYTAGKLSAQLYGVSMEDGSKERTGHSNSYLQLPRHTV